MPVGSETLIAGQYTVTYNSSSMGIMEGDAGVPTISQSAHEENINNTDKYGKSSIDGVYQGGDFFCSFTCMEYKASTIAAWWPYGSIGAMGVIARLRYSLASALVLTAVAGTPAESSPASVTCNKAILAGGFNTQLLFGPLLRKLPIRLQLYPHSNGGTVWFTTS